VNGETYIHPTRAAQMIGLTMATIANWTKAGVTTYGLELTVRRQGKHRLIPEREAVIMAELNKTYPLRKGPIPADQLDDLKRAARYYSKPQPIAAQP
jgi:predicted site-specific integrase-resolvase